MPVSRRFLLVAVGAASAAFAFSHGEPAAEAVPDPALGISAVRTAPPAGEGVQRTFAHISGEANFDPSEIRQVGEFDGTHWFVAPNAHDGVCLMSIDRGGSWGGGCNRDTRGDYDGGFWAWLSLGGSRQLAAILVPDRYDRLEVIGNDDVEVTQPRRNLAFVAGRTGTSVKLTGPDVPPITVDVPNRLAELGRSTPGG